LSATAPPITVDMALIRSKAFVFYACAFGLTFVVLMTIRLDGFEYLFGGPRTFSHRPSETLPNRESWMSIFQGNRKIGFSHSRFFTENDGYRLQENVYMRINTMGILQDISLSTIGRLQPDLTLKSFDFEISSGRFRYRIEGHVTGSVMSVLGAGAGKEQRIDLPLRDTPYLMAGIIDAMAATGLKPNERFVFSLFDPATMGQAPITVEVLEWEDIQIADQVVPAAKLAMHFKGSTQLAWISRSGELLRQKGLLGIRFEKSRRESALSGLHSSGSEDMTLAASVPVNRQIQSPALLEKLRLKISGIDFQNLHLVGGRQTLENGILTIRKESLDDLPETLDPQRFGRLESIFTMPDAFIQSDHEKIKTLVREILNDHPAATPFEKVRIFMRWIGDNIERRPVLSLPDALSTLENRMGDCNEHAMLMAALARADGIPARLEAGLVYLNERFYYHAWNQLYLGRWITLDALFGQLPADVTHLRFTTGSQQQQLDLMGVIGKVKLEIIE